jgi:hypothetical protein
MTFQHRGQTKEYLNQTVVARSLSGGKAHTLHSENRHFDFQPNERFAAERASLMFLQDLFYCVVFRVSKHHFQPWTVGLSAQRASEPVLKREHPRIVRSENIRGRQLKGTLTL